MKKSRKYLVEMLVFVASVIVFYLIFDNWDNIKEFIGSLF